MKLCSVTGCETRHIAKGYCPKHYYSWSTYGDPERTSQVRLCSVEGCSNVHCALGLCRKHWKRQHKGLPLDMPDRYGLTQEERQERNRLRSAAHRTVTDQEVIDTYGTDCHLCGDPIDMQAPRYPAGGEGWERGFQREHVIALANGGPDTLDNTRPSHALCNVRKGVRDLQAILDTNVC